MSKVRTRNKDIALIRQHFTLLLEENFENIFPKSDPHFVEEEDDTKGNRKRSRSSDADNVDEINAKKSSRGTKKDGDERASNMISIQPTKMAYNEKVRSDNNLPILSIMNTCFSPL